jgi:predicted outer membrane repeat protein
MGSHSRAVDGEKAVPGAYCHILGTLAERFPWCVRHARRFRNNSAGYNGHGGAISVESGTTDGSSSASVTGSTFVEVRVSIA